MIYVDTINITHLRKKIPTLKFIYHVKKNNTIQPQPLGTMTLMISTNQYNYDLPGLQHNERTHLINFASEGDRRTL